MRNRPVAGYMSNRAQIGKRTQRELDACRASSAPEARNHATVRARIAASKATRRFASSTSLLGFLFEGKERG